MGKKKKWELKPEVAEVLARLEDVKKELAELRRECPHDHKEQKDPFDYQTLDEGWAYYACPECGREWKERTFLERTTHETKELNTD